MKKLLFALAVVLAPFGAFAQCNGIFPANTLCGNLTGSPAPPAPFSAGGSVIGPGTTVVGDLAIWNNITGTLLKDSNVLPNGTTGTTQAANDNTTKAATDAFVLQQFGQSNVLGNGSSATTQSANDNTTKLATDAFVLQQLTQIQTLPNGSTATTQSVGDATTKVATDAFVLNQLAAAASPGLVSINGVLTPAINTVYNVKLNYNASCNYNAVTDGAISIGSATLTSATASFKLADVGKYIAVQTAGGAGAALFTTISSFTNSTTVGLSAANASGSNLTGLTVEYGNDDTSAFQNAVNAAITAGGGTVYIPAGNRCLISRLNLTNLSISLTIRGDGVNASEVFPLQVASYGTSSGHMFDLTGSSFVRLENFQVGAFYELAQPTTAVFMAQVASGVSNRNGMDHMYISGRYSGCTFYDYGVPSLFTIKDSDFYNYTAGAGAHDVVCLSATNINSYTSSFATVTTGTKSTSDIAFLQTEFHKFSGAGADNFVVLLDSVANISFFSGVLSGGATAYVDLVGANGTLSFHNVTMETESQPVTPTNGYNVAAAATFTWLDDPGTTYIISGSTFSSAPTSTTSVHFSH